MSKSTGKLAAAFSALVVMITVGAVSSFVMTGSNENEATVINQTESNIAEDAAVNTEKNAVSQNESNITKTDNPANDIFADSETVTEYENEVAVNSNLLLSMNGDEKRKLNIFLSNFSEGFLDNYGKGDPNETYNLINFAFWHNTINNPAKVVYTDENMGISASNVDATLEKYIGITVPRQTASVTVDDWTYEWRYEDGMFWTQADESDSCFSFFNIAKEMYDNHNGTYTVIFEVFDDSNLGGTLEEYEAALSKCYSYTSEEALTAGVSQGNGTAVVRKKIYNGKETYELIEYDFK